MANPESLTFHENEKHQSIVMLIPETNLINRLLSVVTMDFGREYLHPKLLLENFRPTYKKN